MKAYEFILKEKRRIATKKKDTVKEVIEKWKWRDGENTPMKTTVLYKIYSKNRNIALLEKIENKWGTNSSPPVHSNLIGIVSDPAILAFSYKSIRANKGTMTKAHPYQSKESWKKLHPTQKRMLILNRQRPDGIAMDDFYMISLLIKRGLYPWGTSKRIYIDKPGDPKKKRPITIPPFMDRVVQEAIRMVLEAIYEPWFEKRNRAFGFRPNKGTRDAMIAITSKLTNNLYTAIEGDISGAYDNVDKHTLIKILQKRINDKKFIRLIQSRLDSEIYDTEKRTYKKTEKGIPQGGIDSPYLFNIYMMDFDEFIHNELQDYINELNKKIDPSKPNRSKASIRIQNRKRNINIKIDFRKKQLSENPSLDEKTKEKYKREILQFIREIRLLTHKFRRSKNSIENRNFLRIFYVRYADDWILLTNANIQLANILKQKIAKWLRENLSATLSETQTFVTDIRKQPAKFLGFQITQPQHNKVKYIPRYRNGSLIRYVLQKSSGHLTRLGPENQRYIDRLYMKGFCTRKGFPREIPWLSTLEPEVIIMRFNAVLTGMVQDKAGLVPFHQLSRWIYIITYSCFKTLAQKYKVSLKQLLRKRGISINGNRTVRFTTVIKAPNDTYDTDFFKREWTLLTYKQLRIIASKMTPKIKKLSERFWEIEKGNTMGNYPRNLGRTPRVTDQDYLDAITWVNFRTQAQFDLPCAICGSTEDVEMHHIKAVRKNESKLIPQARTWEQVMALRNRKQIPVCHECHIKKIHGGTYNDPALKEISPKKLVDNRIVHIENFIKRGAPHYAKDLVSKGWTPYHGNRESK